MTDTLTRVKWERSTENAPDLHPFLNAAVAAVVVGGISMTATALQDAAGAKWAILFSVLTGLIAFLIYFTLLLIRQSQLGMREWTVETPVVPETGRALRVMVADLDSPKTIHVANYKLSEVDMTRVANELDRIGWQFTRDNMRRTRAFPDADIKDWTNTVRASFLKAGLIDERNRVTERGRALFTPFLSPTPAPFQPTYNPPPARRPEVDAGEDAMSAWGREVGQ